MKPNERNLESIRNFFFNEFKIAKDKINKDTSLLYDLEMKGDDIDEIFSRLIQNFDIEVKKLDLSKYYIGDEPGDFVSPVIRVFKRQDIGKMPTLTIGNIEEFIKTGILE